MSVDNSNFTKFFSQNPRKRKTRELKTFLKNILVIWGIFKLLPIGTFSNTFWKLGLRFTKTGETNPLTMWRGRGCHNFYFSFKELPKEHKTNTLEETLMFDNIHFSDVRQKSLTCRHFLKTGSSNVLRLQTAHQYYERLIHHKLVITDRSLNKVRDRAKQFLLTKEEKKNQQWPEYSCETTPPFSIYQQHQISTPTQKLQPIKQGMTT